MVAQAVPAERPAGFRTYNVERIGKVVLRYGLNVRARQMQATLEGAPMNRSLSLVSHPKHADTFLAVARALATAPCSVTVDRR